MLRPFSARFIRHEADDHCGADHRYRHMALKGMSVAAAWEKPDT